MGAFDHLREGQLQHGYWGEVTSSIDWCELNWQHFSIVAELVNTLTNVPVIALGLYGAWAHVAAGCPRRYAVAFLGLALIGVGSFGFHASLKWEWQLMDELPMIYVVSWSAYMVFDTLPTWDFRWGYLGPLAVLAWDVFVTVSYIALPNPVYHQVAFAAIMSTAVFRSVYLATLMPAGHPLKTAVARNLLAGVLIFVAGFAIWNVDNLFCDHLRAVRAALSARGLGPLGAFTEGHGYWHLMTGYGAYLILTSTAWIPVVHPVAAGRPGNKAGEGKAPVKAAPVKAAPVNEKAAKK